jgi:hypothetical protein
MWGFQRSFRTSVEIDLERSLRALGVGSVKPAVFLIGVLRIDGPGYPLCIEPENGPIIPADFDELHHRADAPAHQRAARHPGFAGDRNKRHIGYIPAETLRGT